ncbi:MAG: methylmalonyl-CoA mutase [Dehalococcoidia bacterium]|nr:MAG: methylmalonyl-CoA mutase [Dehalococcoidia bacterium]
MAEGKIKEEKIRVVMSILGLDQHDLALRFVSYLLRDAGMEIVYLGCLQTVEATVNAAAQEDADVIGLSCHSWEYIHYIPQLLALLRDRKLDIPVIVGGGILTEQDEAQLKEMGVSGVFRGGATAEEIIKHIEQAAEPKRLARE